MSDRPPVGRMTEETLQALTSDQVVTRSLLVANAAHHPDRHFAEFDGGERWTYAQALREAAAAAHTLRALGVRQGSCLAVLLPNGADFIRSWFGAAMLGATVCPINPALRGSLLRRPLALSRPVAVVADPSRRAALEDDAALGRTVLVDPGELRGREDRAPELERGIELWDIEKLLMTSGTTGPSKLVLVPYLHSYWGYATILRENGFTADDVFQIDLPLFHSAAMGYVNATLANGSAIYVRPRPALDRYWETIRDARVSAAILISSMVPAMMRHPARSADREHRMKFMVTAPIPPDIAAFRSRFGVPVLMTSLGSTEASTPIRGYAEPGADPSYCGEVVPGWEVRVVDRHDQQIPVGDAGEAIVRCSRPSVMSPGYVDDPAATASAWTNAWFHTGDLVRQDAKGSFYFVGRTKDAIRRRGENISAYEVELAMSAHAAVAEVACVPAPSDDGVDDEVKVWIVLKPGAPVHHSQFLEHAFDRLPHHMVPRFYEFTSEIPKTPTGKPQKYSLKERGNTEATWDRVENGYRVTRRGIEHTALPPD